MKNWKRKEMLNEVKKELDRYISISEGMEDEFWMRMEWLSEELHSELSEYL